MAFSTQDLLRVADGMDRVQLRLVELNSVPASLEREALRSAVIDSVMAHRSGSLGLLKRLLGPAGSRAKDSLLLAMQGVRFDLRSDRGRLDQFNGSTYPHLAAPAAALREQLDQEDSLWARLEERLRLNVGASGPRAAGDQEAIRNAYLNVAQRIHSYGASLNAAMDLVMDEKAAQETQYRGLMSELDGLERRMRLDVLVIIVGFLVLLVLGFSMFRRRRPASLIHLHP